MRRLSNDFGKTRDAEAERVRSQPCAPDRPSRACSVPQRRWLVAQTEDVFQDGEEIGCLVARGEARS